MKPTILGSGKVYNIQCSDTSIPEFPALRFGEHEDGSKYFDATFNLLQNSNRQLSVEGFFKNFDFQIQAIAKEYQIPQEQLVIINTEGHQLVVGCLCYLFLSYVQPSFNAYLFERIDEMFTAGMVMSDSYLAQVIQQRFTPDILKDIFNGGKKTAQASTTL